MYWRLGHDILIRMLKIITITLIALLLLVQYGLWLGEGSWPRLWELQRNVQAQQQENTRLAERNQQLQVEVSNLKQGLETVEEKARTELGMIKQGETFYQVVEP